MVQPAAWGITAHFLLPRAAGEVPGKSPYAPTGHKAPLEQLFLESCSLLLHLPCGLLLHCRTHCPPHWQCGPAGLVAGAS